MEKELEPLLTPKERKKMEATKLREHVGEPESDAANYAREERRLDSLRKLLERKRKAAKTKAAPK